MSCIRRAGEGKGEKKGEDERDFCHYRVAFSGLPHREGVVDRASAPRNGDSKHKCYRPHALYEMLMLKTF